ncbi:hypothetical protein N9N34_02645 [Candidatus Pelagibacter bacterium]|nr:hypothetical protein [Candidatus Pelagibacter bacterium]
MLFMLTSCGFEAVNNKNIKSFSVKDLVTTGDNRVSYLVKNKINLLQNKESQREIKINLDIKKVKNIKEKNIKNEITKHELIIIIDIIFIVSDYTKTFKLQQSIIGDYAVAKSYSDTLNNEKELIKLLSNQISENIFSEISLRINDL